MSLSLGQRPDAVSHSASGEENGSPGIDGTHVGEDGRVSAKYVPLAQELHASGWKATILGAEVGARVFVGASAYNTCRRLGMTAKETSKALKTMAEAAERASCWICSIPNDSDPDATSGRTV